MNKVVLVGNLCRDNELRYSTGENSTAMLRNTIAVQRRFKNSDGNYESDFVNIQAWGKTAEFINQYFQKGSKIGITGRITTGSYTNKDGNKVYTTDVTVEEAEFVGGKSESNQSETSPSSAHASNDGFMKVPEGSEEELPFN